MPQHCAVINSGYSSWWLLTLSPLIYYDRLRVYSPDLTSIHEQEGKSYFNSTTNCVLRALERYVDEEIIIRDDRMPPRGRGHRIEQDSKAIADALLHHASEWSHR